MINFLQSSSWFFGQELLSNYELHPLLCCLSFFLSSRSLCLKKKGFWSVAVFRWERMKERKESEWKERNRSGSFSLFFLHQNLLSFSSVILFSLLIQSPPSLTSSSSWSYVSVGRFSSHWKTCKTMMLSEVDGQDLTPANDPLLESEKKVRNNREVTLPSFYFIFFLKLALQERSTVIL